MGKKEKKISVEKAGREWKEKKRQFLLSLNFGFKFES
jgi:hypothetical protein